MKLNKIISLLFVLLLFFQFPMLGQTDTWKHVYTDVELNISNIDGTVGLAGGYKMNRFVGFGLKMERHFGYENLNSLSFNFRGTNFKPGDRFGFYYTASVGKKFGDEDTRHLELTAGVRYKRVGLGLRLTENGLSFKVSQLFGDFKGKGPLERLIFAPTLKSRYQQPTDDDTKKRSLRKMATYFHLLIGASSINDDPDIIDFNSNYNGITFNLAKGYQLNEYLGFGIALHTATTGGNNSPSYSFVGWGANFNGYPGVFFYNATLGFVGAYELISDRDTRFQVFKKSKGVSPFFEVKGGIRFFRRCSLGVSYFGSSKIKGNYQRYDNPSNPQVIVIDETRRIKFSGIQVFFGLAI